MKSINIMPVGELGLGIHYCSYGFFFVKVAGKVDLKGIKQGGIGSV